MKDTSPDNFYFMKRIFQAVFHTIYFPLKIKSAKKEQFYNYFNKYKSIITIC